MKLKFFIIILVLGFSSQFYGQMKHKMEFPNIYFKLNSTDYAEMPYKVDSCFKFIINDLSKDPLYNKIELAIWRDSCETEQLTKRRIKKIKNELSKFNVENKFEFKDSGSWQKYANAWKLKDDKKGDINRYILTLGSMLEVTTFYITPCQTK
jgi:predicted transglutaminase-like cysteine proteinase